MSSFSRDDELCQRYAQFASHMVRWQFKVIYWAMFITNLAILCLATWIYIKGQDVKDRYGNETMKRARRLRLYLCLCLACVLVSTVIVIMEAYALLALQFCDGEDLMAFYWSSWTTIQVGSWIAMVGIILALLHSFKHRKPPPWTLALGTPVPVIAGLLYLFHNCTMRRFRNRRLPSYSSGNDGNEDLPMSQANTIQTPGDENSAVSQPLGLAAPPRPSLDNIQVSKLISVPATREYFRTTPEAVHAIHWGCRLLRLLEERPTQQALEAIKIWDYNSFKGLRKIACAVAPELPEVMNAVQAKRAISADIHIISDLRRQIQTYFDVTKPTEASLQPLADAGLFTPVRGLPHGDDKELQPLSSLRRQRRAVVIQRAAGPLGSLRRPFQHTSRSLTVGDGTAAMRVAAVSRSDSSASSSASGPDSTMNEEHGVQSRPVISPGILSPSATNPSANITTDAIGIFRPEEKDPYRQGIVHTPQGQTIYTDVHLFCDSLRSFQRFGDDCLIPHYPAILQGRAKLWLQVELSFERRIALLEAPIPKLCKALSRRFQRTTDEVLEDFHSNPYTTMIFDDISLEQWAQRKVSLARQAGITKDRDILRHVFKMIDPEIQRCLIPPGRKTKISHFIRDLVERRTTITAHALHPSFS